MPGQSGAARVEQGPCLERPRSGPRRTARTLLETSTSARSARQRIVAIDGDEQLLGLLRHLLAADGYDVLVRAEFEGAHELVRRAQPRLVLLDLPLGAEERGWRVLDWLTLDPGTRGIPVVLCSRTDEALTPRGPSLAHRPGVHGLLKPFSLDELRATLSRALEGDARARPSADARGVALRALTRREQEVAALIARGYSNAEIADRLVLAKGTVANHVEHIMNKLGVANRTQIALLAAAAGQQLTGSEAARRGGDAVGLRPHAGAVAAVTT